MVKIEKNRNVLEVDERDFIIFYEPVGYRIVSEQKKEKAPESTEAKHIKRNRSLKLKGDVT